MVLDSIEEVQKGMRDMGYVAEEGLATVVFLASSMGKPLFLEGEPGVGKTELANVLAKMLNTDLIRLQCYEGLDAHSALYEWNYAKQLLTIRMLEDQKRSAKDMTPEIFSQDFLIARPLLKAIKDQKGSAPVLLIDELDRADEEFEAFLLEFLGEFQITIPEVGTIKADKPPLVVLTSNRTRDVHDALKRRCLYHWIDLPEYEKELAIVRAKAPLLNEVLAGQVTGFMQKIRKGNLLKRPGISETLDWAKALILLAVKELDPKTIEATKGCIFKHQEDLKWFSNQDLTNLNSFFGDLDNFE